MRVLQSPPPKTVEALETMLPLLAIRRHLKIDDYSGVADETLALLRSAAVEAFETYTGRLLSPPQAFRQPVRIPNWTSIPQAARARIVCPLLHPAVSGVLTLEYVGRMKLVQVPPRAMQFEWPLSFPRPWAFWSVPFSHTGFLNECNTCGGGTMDPEIPYLSYVIGGDVLGPGATLGCLQYIAFAYEHPGDELVSVADRYARVGANGLQGTNNVLLASGAYQSWRPYRGRLAR